MKEYILKRTTFSKIYAALAFVLLVAMGTVDKIMLVFAFIVILILIVICLMGKTIIRCNDEQIEVQQYRWVFTKIPKITVINIASIKSVKRTITNFSGGILTIHYNENQSISFREDENKEWAEKLTTLHKNTV